MKTRGTLGTFLGRFPRGRMRARVHYTPRARVGWVDGRAGNKENTGARLRGGSFYLKVPHITHKYKLRTALCYGDLHFAILGICWHKPVTGLELRSMGTFGFRGPPRSPEVPIDKKVKKSLENAGVVWYTSSS